ncbi:relaxase/mobilization nuclease domain-containing protein [Burkholderia cenocepacia]|uniref:relaxase/mobilization nuclease domain-containing protein n=1 Tax=Burkholderia cenocepacia TaxID=95486 RepID=UPI0013E02CD2|nr:relaxase/mobilization nuclease domain-containing protein [Burkholderia cenocepacia]MCW3583696.1 relaxase/mobilization nuclease domain-containing protein [Burkholderia cenocepacia]MCW3629100.1 relaxase/mobilization nuclease domain-containing protein [Burkholderia cenocepacia]MCW5185112.1 relaxase/mobilization nuclease domain-containing protein [Burkholderia cenocepacia]
MLVSNFDSKQHPTVKGAVDYVLSGKNHKGDDRPNKPEVLKGDEFLTRHAGELSTKFTNQRTSGVIAFAKGEKPTREEMLKIIDRYEQTFLGNMRDRVAPLYVLHEEKDGKHIHVIIPNIDLQTGKAYNPFQPGDTTKDLIKAFSSLENFNHNWKQIKEDPLKPSHTKTEHKASAHKNDSEFFRNLFNNAKDKRTFEKACLDLVKSGEVKNRDELISFLKDNGYTFSRIGKDYLSIENSNGKNFRLKDGIFSSGADYKEQVKEATEKVKTFDPYKTAEQINRLVAYRNAYNEKRYQASEPKAQAYTAKPLATKTAQNAPQAPRASGSTLPPTSSTTNAPGATSPVPQTRAEPTAQAQHQQQEEKNTGGSELTPSGHSSGLNAIGSAQAQLSSALAQLNNATTPMARAQAQMAVIRARGAVAKAEAQYEEEQRRKPTTRIKI